MILTLVTECCGISLVESSTLEKLYRQGNSVPLLSYISFVSFTKMPVIPHRMPIWFSCELT